MDILQILKNNEGDKYVVLNDISSESRIVLKYGDTRICIENNYYRKKKKKTFSFLAGIHNTTKTVEEPGICKVRIQGCCIETIDMKEGYLIHWLNNDLDYDYLASREIPFIKDFTDEARKYAILLKESGYLVNVNHDGFNMTGFPKIGTIKVISRNYNCYILNMLSAEDDFFQLDGFRDFHIKKTYLLDAIEEDISYDFLAKQEVSYFSELNEYVKETVIKLRDAGYLVTVGTLFITELSPISVYYMNDKRNYISLVYDPQDKPFSMTIYNYYEDIDAKNNKRIDRSLFYGESICTFNFEMDDLTEIIPSSVPADFDDVLEELNKK